MLQNCSFKEKDVLDMGRRILNLVLISIGSALFIYQVYELIVKIIYFTNRDNMAGFWVINLFALTIFLFIITRKAVLVIAHVISALDVFVVVSNKLLFNAFLWLGQAYIRTVTSKNSIIGFGYDSAVNSVRLLISIVVVVLFLIWLRYATVIYHNIKELGV